MGYVLHERLRDAEPPRHPYVSTHDGFAWHDNPVLRPCFQGGYLVGEVGAELVSRALGGAPIERLLALLEIWQKSTAAVDRLFPVECAACGRNHHREVRQFIWAACKIAPEAVEALRTANIPMWALMHPRLPAGPRDLGGRPRKGSEPRWRGLPVGRTPAESAARQVAYAAEMKVRHECSPSELARFARRVRKWRTGELAG